METMPGDTQSYPPPPPPPHSRKGLWIGLAIGAVVLCLCCIVVVVGVYFFRQNIPYLSNFLSSPTPTFLPTSIPSPTPIASPTPSGLFYNNPSVGISLTYPDTWQYVESGDATSGYTIIFASSADILNSPTSAPQTGAAIAILTHFMTIYDIPFTANASSMGEVLDYINSDYFDYPLQGQTPRTFTLSGYPAASNLYTMTSDTGVPEAALIIAVLRNEVILLFSGVCSQTEWSQYKLTFSTIMNSVSIVSP
jgi:hypothetical protein